MFAFTISPVIPSHLSFTTIHSFRLFFTLSTSTREFLGRIVPFVVFSTIAIVPAIVDCDVIQALLIDATLTWLDPANLPEHSLLVLLSNPQRFQ